MNGLAGKTAIVTGAARGIGRAIALELAKNKVNVAFNFVKDETSAKILEKELRLGGVDAMGVKADIQSSDEVQRFVEKTKATFKNIDFLVNNAGILSDKTLMLMSTEDWDKVIDINLSGTYRVTRALITGFLKQKNGSIVNISSTAGITGNAGQTNYSASKAGIIGFTKALAKESAAYNVRANVVAPGFVSTEMVKDIPENKMSDFVKNIPMKRVGAVEEVARVVLFLLSDDSSYITGHVFPVDGGLAI